jgi:hypothetical protein
MADGQLKVQVNKGMWQPFKIEMDYGFQWMNAMMFPVKNSFKIRIYQSLKGNGNR